LLVIRDAAERTGRSRRRHSPWFGRRHVVTLGHGRPVNDRGRGRHERATPGAGVWRLLAGIGVLRPQRKQQSAAAASNPRRGGGDRGRDLTRGRTHRAMEKQDCHGRRRLAAGDPRRGNAVSQPGMYHKLADKLMTTVKSSTMPGDPPGEGGGRTFMLPRGVLSEPAAVWATGTAIADLSHASPGGFPRES